MKPIRIPADNRPATRTGARTCSLCMECLRSPAGAGRTCGGSEYGQGWAGGALGGRIGRRGNGTAAISAPVPGEQPSLTQEDSQRPRPTPVLQNSLLANRGTPPLLRAMNAMHNSTEYGMNAKVLNLKDKRLARCDAD